MVYRRLAGENCFKKRSQKMLVNDKREYQRILMYGAVSLLKTLNGFEKILMLECSPSCTLLISIATA